LGREQILIIHKRWKLGSAGAERMRGDGEGRGKGRECLVLEGCDVRLGVPSFVNGGGKKVLHIGSWDSMGI